MSVETLTVLAQAVGRDPNAQARYEAMPDDALAALGLDEDEIDSIRSGFFDRALRLGIARDEAPYKGGCC